MDNGFKERMSIDLSVTDPPEQHEAAFAAALLIRRKSEEEVRAQFAEAARLRALEEKKS